MAEDVEESGPNRKPVYLAPDLHERLKAHAAADGRTLTWIVARALEEYLDRGEATQAARQVTGPRTAVSEDRAEGRHA